MILLYDNQKFPVPDKCPHYPHCHIYRRNRVRDHAEGINRNLCNTLKLIRKD